MNNTLFSFILILLPVILTGGGLFFYMQKKLMAHSKPTVCQPLAMVFDLGNVLIQTNKKKFTHITGKGIWIKYALRHPRHIKNVQQRFLSFLHSIETPCVLPDHPYEDGSGNPLPKCMHPWLSKANHCHKTLLNKIENTLENDEYECASSTEKNIFRAMAHAIFNPEQFAHTQEIIPEGLEFVKACKARGHRIYILSNWDSASFNVLRNKYPEFFELFDGITISGTAGTLKPNPDIYTHFLNEHNLKPSECFFLDDQPHNVAAAYDHSMHGMVCPYLLTKKNIPHFEKVETVLAELHRNNALPFENYSSTIV